MPPTVVLTPHALTAPAPVARRGPAIRARLRRLLVIEFGDLRDLDLGDRNAFGVETAVLFERGGHGCLPSGRDLV